MPRSLRILAIFSATLLICGVAGAKSIDWLVGYMREDLGDRLRASWSLGL